MKDYYKILHVNRNATETEIKKSYRELALKFHPDKTQEPALHAKFKEINEAYQVLSKKENREDYNLTYDYHRYSRSPHPFFDPEKGYFKNPSKVKKPVYKPFYYYRKHEELNLVPYVNTMKILSGLTFLFAFLVILDYFLPAAVENQTIITKLTSYSSFNSVIIATEQLEFPLNYSQSKLLDEGDPVTVELTPIFKINYQLIADNGLKVYAFNPDYSIYNVYSFFLVILIFTSYIGTFNKKENAELIFSAGVANVFLAMLIIYLIHIS